MQACECGCGQIVRGSFVHGHNSRVANAMRTTEGVTQFKISRKSKWGGRTSRAYLDRRTKLRLEIKREALTYYGHNKCACVNCGYNDIRALSIDHVNGNGNRHRKMINVEGGEIYTWLKKNDYPLGFQTLCMNCQFIKKQENAVHSRKKI